MIKKGYSTSEIADIYDMSVEEIKKIEASLLQKA
jgi:DNA-binding CsgD family transcriptional regulator